MVLYFSGTGNSRFVAKRVADFLNDEIHDIAEYIRGNKSAEFTERGTYVFVAPSYVSAPARVMTDFVEKAVFPEGVSAYFLITCAASMGITPRIAAEICEKKGIKYMGSAQFEMPQNYIIYFTTHEKDYNCGIIDAAIPKIDEVAGKIKAGEVLADRKPVFLEVPATKITGDLYYKYFMGTKKFSVNDTCISCGKCEKSCAFSNISLRDGKPIWGTNCTHCMACINLCPVSAIEFGKGTKGKPRFPGPDATLANT